METFAYSPREDQRLAHLESYNILDTPAEAEFDALTQLAAHICQTPVALITFIDADRQWFKSKRGLDISETPRNVSFCQYTIQTEEWLEVTDAQFDERFRNNPFVTGEPYIRYYCGVPLVTPEGFSLGSLCVIDYQPNQLTPLQKQVLQTLASEVMVRLELKRQLKRLEQEQERLRQEKKKLEYSEKRFRTLFENAEGYLFTHDLAGNILAVNSAMAAALQYEQGELVGKNQLTLVPEEDRAAFKGYLQRVGEGQTVSGVGRILTKNGTERFWLYRNFLYEDSLGEAYVIGSAHDVTDKEVAGQILQQAHDQLEARVGLRTGQLLATNQALGRAKDELSTFLYRAFHDLKGPVSTLKGLIQLIQEDYSVHQLPQYLVFMVQTVLKLEHVLNSLLVFTSNRNTNVKCEHINFAVMLQEINQYCRQIKGFERIQFEVVTDEATPFFSDPERVKAVLQGLLANSIAFQDFAQETPFVRLEIYTDTQKATFVIQDNGVGIREESLSTIFEMFSKSSDQSNGPGLGLYLVKEVLNQLAGTIQVTSQQGKGTVFTLEIPNQDKKQ